MTFKKGNAAVNAEADAFTAKLDGGYIEVRAGAQPSSVDATATGTLLATITLNNPAFSDQTNGVATLDVPVEGAAVATGVAGWARFYSSSDEPIIDCNVTEAGGGGELIIADENIAASDPVKVTAFTYTIPKE